MEAIYVGIERLHVEILTSRGAGQIVSTPIGSHTAKQKKLFDILGCHVAMRARVSNQPIRFNRDNSIRTSIPKTVEGNAENTTIWKDRHVFALATF